MGILTLVILAFVFLLNPQNIYAADIYSFPGAEGFGAAETIGGRGGTVYEVTNLNDSGVGSLRACVIASGPRTCIFKVGGTITLSSQLVVTNPYITIAGQTAPGGGITLRKNSGSGGDLITSKTHDVIVRYISGRVGPGGEDHVTQLSSNNSTSIYNIIFDHCSFSWGVDSIWETWYQTHNVTLQWSFISEGLDCSTHSKGCHSKGVMIGGYKQGENSTSRGSYDVSLHHNLMAHNGERTPLMQFCGTGQVVNNITYNPYWTFSHQELNCIDPNYQSNVNWIGNYHKQGPDSTSTKNLKVSVTGNNGKGGAYVANNLSRLKNKSTDSNWVIEANGFIVNTPFPAPAITTTSATDAYDNVLNEGGNSKGIDCNGNWFNRRDSIDARVVNEVKTGTGHIIDDPSEVGGWITIAGGTACTDTDRDGIPDGWEVTFGLNPNNISDGAAISSNGYTNLENYINGVSGLAVNTPSPDPTASPSPAPVYNIADIFPDDLPDGAVDIFDFNKIIENFGLTGVFGWIKSDIVKNGKVDIFDFNKIIENFGHQL